MQTMKLGKVSLNVMNLQKQKEFYQEIIGLDIIEETEEEISLGILETKDVLVSLVHQSNLSVREGVTGLYHLALLLPTRKSLSGMLRHFLEVKAPLIGASDHGYSEALYLQDPEGNGIEIYWDKPKEVWDIQTNGQIKGVTLEINSAELFGLTTDSLKKMPKGTKIGHVHLSVADFEKNETFYQGVLGMSLVDDLGGHARFFSRDGYHHHVGVNNWQGTLLENREEKNQGILSFEMNWLIQEHFEQVKANLKQQNMVIDEKNDHYFSTIDPNGIMLEMTLG